VADDDAALFVRRAQGEIWIRNADLDIGTVGLSLQEARQPGRTGLRRLGREIELGRVPGRDELLVGGNRTRVADVLGLPRDLPQVMVVIARQVIDDRIEDRGPATERHPREAAEDTGGYLIG